MGLAPSSPPIGRQRPTLGTTVAPARHYPQPGFSGGYPQIPDRAVGVPARHRVSFTASQRGALPGPARLQQTAEAADGPARLWVSLTTIVCIPNGTTCTAARCRLPRAQHTGACSTPLTGAGTAPTTDRRQKSAGWHRPACAGSLQGCVLLVARSAAAWRLSHCQALEALFSRSGRGSGRDVGR
jgi:hypothetical protein